MKQDFAAFFVFTCCVIAGLVINNDAPTKSGAVAIEHALPNHLREYEPYKWLSGSVTKEDLRTLAQNGLKTVIRLNGDGHDAGHLTKQEEAAICHELGLQFMYYNIEGDVLRSAAEMADIIARGYVLVHCKNGAHRAPGVVAYYLKRAGHTCDRVVETVGWQKLIQDPGKYRRYTDIINCRAI